MNNDVLVTIIATLALGGIGYLVAEMRRSHNSLTGDIKEVRSDLTKRIDDVAASLSGDIKAVRSDLTKRVDDIATRLGRVEGFLSAGHPPGHLRVPERDSTPSGS